MTPTAAMLTEREKEVLRLLAHGHDAKSAARELGLSVHSVNERLRATRRKLEVTSSKEAVRLLLRDEGPQFFGDKEFGIGTAAPARQGAGLDQRNGALLAGGLAAMLLLAASLYLFGPGLPSKAKMPLAHWSLREDRAAVAAEVTNDLRLVGDRMLWNGAPVSDAQVAQYFAVVRQMNPQPITVLSYGTNAPTDRLQRLRATMDQALACRPATCVEIVKPRD